MAAPCHALLTHTHTAALTHPGACAAAGLGRAPATALAWMWWFKDWHLEDAYEHLTGALCLQCYHAAGPTMWV